MSSNEVNPYSAPAALPDATPPPIPFHLFSPLYFRDGKFLVVRDGAELPDVCLRTHESVGGSGWRKKVPIVWTPPWVIALIVITPLIGLLVMMITRKRARITYSLNGDTRGKILRWRFIGAALLMAAIGLFFMAAGSNNDDTMLSLIIGGFAALLAALVPLAISNPIKVAGYENGWFKIKGCSPAFLDILPHPPGGF
ncbi:hypothetical protein OVA24_04510 [Luteolibacter sp. SL250]|uniref:hypothetical protein n=1 Tax=Luteolibacter sp. SL250 TaxID=2995170 RepID=UPI002271B052|nr:hypothetical protein [Luteolibacter sp. SL250]WAC20641.1 hypothetical protein OVA24_04510 [Luteolibacter sp. SL250]